MLVGTTCMSGRELSRLSGRLSSVNTRLTVAALVNSPNGVSLLGTGSRTVSGRGGRVLGGYNVNGVRCSYPVYSSDNCINNGVYSYVGGVTTNIVLSSLGGRVPLSSYAFRDFSLGCCDASNRGPEGQVATVLGLYGRCIGGFGPRGTRGLLFVKDPNLNGARLALTVISNIIRGNFVTFCNPTRGLFSLVSDRHFSNRGGNDCRTVLGYSLLMVSSLNARLLGRFSGSILCGLVGDHLLSGGPAIVGAGLAVTRVTGHCNRHVTSQLVNGFGTGGFLKRSVERRGFLRRGEKV